MHKKELQIGGRTLSLETGTVARQANGACVIRYGDTVVLAGDLFDLFVGNKRIFRERYGDFFRALETAGKKGVETHYIEGNHDFLIRAAFRGIPGLRVHVHEVSLELGGRKFFFATMKSGALLSRISTAIPATTARCARAHASARP